MLSKQKQAFTLLEILISVILVSIGLSAVVGAFFSGRYFLRQAEDKTKAMNVASMRMEERLAQTYAQLGNLPASQKGVTCLKSDGFIEQAEGEEQICLSNSGKPFSWEVTIENRTEPSTCFYGSRCIPYRHIQVDVKYQDEKAQAASSDKYVHLANIIPYPYIHIFSVDYGSVSPSPINQIAPSVRGAIGVPPIGPFPPLVNGVYYIADSRVTLPRYEVDKDIEVTYNIALDVTPGSCNPPPDPVWCIDATATIFTACYLYNLDTGNLVGQLGITTRTPIISQPLFSNVGANPTATFHLDKGVQYALELHWYRDRPIVEVGGIPDQPNWAPGTVKFKDGNIIATLYERK